VSYALSAPNAVDVVISWLRPLGQPTYAVRKQGDPLPYRLVTRVAGSDASMYADDAVVSIHTFADTYTDASDYADAGHRRMLLLAIDPTAAITLSDNTVVSVQYAESVQNPIHLDYEEPDIYRFVARYRVGVALHF
jgi:hypothetical protein